MIIFFLLLIDKNLKLQYYDYLFHSNWTWVKYRECINIILKYLTKIKVYNHTNNVQYY